MGADFISSGLWMKAETKVNYEAGMNAANTLTGDELNGFARQIGYDIESADDVRERAVALVETIKDHVVNGSRELTFVRTPDGEWEYYYTGGVSFGDSPGELFDAFNDLWEAPSVLRSLGFWAPTPPPPVITEAPEIDDLKEMHSS